MAPTSTISRSGSREKVPAPSGAQDLTALLMRGPSGPGQGPPRRQGQPHPLHRFLTGIAFLYPFWLAWLA